MRVLLFMVSDAYAPWKLGAGHPVKAVAGLSIIGCGRSGTQETPRDCWLLEAAQLEVKQSGRLARDSLGVHGPVRRRDRTFTWR
jgi:hypothetical protein